MPNPTMLNSDDELAKLGSQILEASIELDDAILAAVRELDAAKRYGQFGLRIQVGYRLADAMEQLARASKARRELLDRMISYSAEAGYPMKL